MTTTTYHEPPDAYRRRRALGTIQRAADRTHRRERSLGWDDRRTVQAFDLLRRLHDVARVD